MPAATGGSAKMRARGRVNTAGMVRCERQPTFDRVRWQVNGDVGQQGHVLRVTDPRSGVWATRPPDAPGANNRLFKGKWRDTAGPAV